MATGLSPPLGVNVVTVELSLTVGSSSRGPFPTCMVRENKIRINAMVTRPDKPDSET